MQRTSIEVDVAIIGAGSAGLVARRQALANGAERVLLIEGGAHGTTCARVGCMPSKLLIAAAEAAHRMSHGAQFGVHAGEVRVDGEAVMARVQRERDRFAGFVVDSGEGFPAEQTRRGWARFVAQDRREVETEAGQVEVRARAIVIATGSTPPVPPPLRGLGARLLTNESIFELPTLPRSLAVVGAGVIGIELGQAMQRLGVETRVLDIATQLPVLTSSAMREVAEQALREELDLHLGIAELHAELVEGGVRLRWREADGRAAEGVFEYVLAATGRRPQLERLELDRAGVELDARGQPRHWDERTTQIADLPLFLAGDVTARRPLLHEAAAEGRFAGKNAARYPDVRAEARDVPLAVMYSSPNIAEVGHIPGPEGEGEDWEAGEIDYGDQGRARVIAEARGKVRIYAERRCGKILGAEMVGPGVEHMAHLLAWSIQQGLTVPRALTMPFYHPVLEEGLRTALSRLASKLKLSERPRPLDCGPGA